MSSIVRLEDLPDEYQPAYKLTEDQKKANHQLAADATHCALGGGSRSGKTFLIIRGICIRADKAPGSRHLVSRFRFNAAKTALAMDTIPKVLKLCFPTWGSPTMMLDKTDWFFRFPNESELWVTGLDDDVRVEKVLGHEYASMFFNECSQIPYYSVETALTRLAQKTASLRLKAYYDLNPPSKQHWTYKKFIEKVDPVTGQPLTNEFDYNYMTMNPHGNAENLDPGYLAQLEGLGERARKRFLYGLFSDDSEGAMWTEELFAQNRVLGQAGQQLPQWLRVVIAVDPSGTKGHEDKRSDEVGIVVGALGTDGHGYLIEDLSGKYPPEVWGQIVADAYERHAADRVYGEANYGGDMVRAVIQAQDPNIAYEAVTATRGKEVRAEPISALYEQHRIHHIGFFPEIEDQLMAMTVHGYTGLKSPDRGDAVIWLFSGLFPKMVKKQQSGPFIPPKINVAPRSSRSHQHAQNTQVRVTTASARKRRVRKI
jgi:hypothetical protein